MNQHSEVGAKNNGEPDAKKEKKELTCVVGRCGRRGRGGEGVEQERSGQKHRQKAPHCLLGCSLFPCTDRAGNQEPRKGEVLQGRGGCWLGEKRGGGDHGYLRTRKDGPESTKEPGLFFGPAAVLAGGLPLLLRLTILPLPPFPLPLPLWTA
jgi:hypothetical protein